MFAATGLSIAFFAALLAFLGFLGYLAGKLLRRRPDGRGPGCILGLLSLAILGGAAAAGLAVFAAALGTIALGLVDAGVWVERSDFEAWGTKRTEADAGAEAPRYVAHVILHLRGDVPLERLRSSIERLTGTPSRITASSAVDREGREVTRVELSFDLSAATLSRLERGIQAVLEDFELPHGAYVELEAIERDT